MNPRRGTINPGNKSDQGRKHEHDDQQRVRLDKANPLLGMIKLPHHGDRDDQNRGKTRDDVRLRRHCHERAVIGEIYRR